MSRTQSYEEFQREAEAFHDAGMIRARTAPAPSKQKFRCGQRVRIAADLGSAMKHFPADRLATVRYTHAHAYGGDSVKSYCLDVDGIGEISWYEERQLIPVEEEWPEEIDA